MNPELDAIIEEYGGTFELGPHLHELAYSIVDATKSRLEKHRQYALNNLYSDRPKPLQFDLIASTSLNTFAYTTPPETQPGLDFIGINVGIPFTLFDIFSRILAHPGTFKDVGNPELEDADGHDLPSLTNDTLQSAHPGRAPRCPIRAIFATELVQVGVNFFFFHELTHLRNGHVDYLRSQLRIPTWQEAVSYSSRPLDPKISQTLEMDADSGATLLTLNAAYRSRDALKNIPLDTPAEALAAYTRAYGTGKLATRTVLFATYMAFRLFGASRWAWELQDTASHPFPPLRMFLILPTLHEIFTQRPGYEYDPNEFDQDFISIVQEAEIACGLICGNEPPDPRGIGSVVQGTEYLRYIDNFTEQWKLLRPELEKYKRGGNLPP